MLLIKVVVGIMDPLFQGSGKKKKRWYGGSLGYPSSDPYTEPARNRTGKITRFRTIIGTIIYLSISGDIFIYLFLEILPAVAF